MSPSNLDIRSRSGATASGFSGSESAVCIASVMSGLQFLHRIHELADSLDLGLHVHRDEDVELILDCRDEIHHGQAIPFEIAREGRAVGERDALLVERV